MAEQLDLPFDGAETERGEDPEPVLVDYEQMVRNLFKRTDYHNSLCGGQDGASLMHAAIGVCGEAYELTQATHLGNIIEELGDLVFYSAAMAQVMVDSGLDDVEGSISETAVSYARSSSKPLQEVLNDILFMGHNLLDSAKRVWIYGNDMIDHQDDLEDNLGGILGAISVYATRLNLDMDSVREQNQIKLGNRYPGGVYSNAAATARADKGD